MKLLLIAEYREEKLLDSYIELITFAEKLGAQASMFLVGDKEQLPSFNGHLYLADAAQVGEFNPALHKQLIAEVVAKEQPQMIVLPHTSYGWDLAPRIALALKAAQVSEVVDVRDGKLVVPVCNGKLQRQVDVQTELTVATLQAGAFNTKELPTGTPEVIEVTATGDGDIAFSGYEAAAVGEVDLGKAKIIVSAGRGIGKAENMDIIQSLAKALNGEYAASRPVVDSGWTDHSRQVGTTGQTVAPKLYIACGISGAIQHLAGIKKAEFIVAINSDKDAPIGEVADILAVADLKQLVPLLTQKLQA